MVFYFEFFLGIYLKECLKKGTALAAPHSYKARLSLKGCPPAVPLSVPPGLIKVRNGFGNPTIIKGQSLTNNKNNMNTQITLEQLGKLKLSGMAKVYQGVLSMPVHEMPSLDQLMAQLAEAELQERANKKTQMFLKVSKLRYNAILENIYCNPQRNFTKDNLLSLAGCSFIGRAENILITGATGCGKSYLACALGRQACTLGYRSLYFGMARLIEKILQSKLEGTYVKFINYLDKASLIIIDDFGLHPLDTTTRLALLQIMEDSYGKRSLIVTSQLPVAKWHSYIDDPTIADAIMDRLAVNASKIELKGDSLRKKN